MANLRYYCGYRANFWADLISCFVLLAIGDPGITVCVKYDTWLRFLDTK